MKRKKQERRTRGVILTIVLLLIRFIFVVAGLLNKRAEKEREEAYEQKTLEEAQGVCEEFLNAYQDKDGEMLTRLLWNQGYGEPVEFSEYMKIAADHLSYEIGKAKKHKDGSCWVSVEITNLDLPAIAELEIEKKTHLKSDSGTALNDFLHLLSDWDTKNLGEMPMKTYKADILLKEENLQWRIEMTDELSDALLGGYVELYSEVVKELEGAQ